MYAHKQHIYIYIYNINTYRPYVRTTSQLGKKAILQDRRF